MDEIQPICSPLTTTEHVNGWNTTNLLAYNNDRTCEWL